MPDLCPVCARRYKRELWTTECLCNGKISPRFIPPGGTLPHHDFVPPPREPVKKPTKKEKRK